MENIKNEKTSVLVYRILVDSHRYGFEYINEARKELSERNYDFSTMDENLYICYVVNDFPFGWQKIAKKMFADLLSKGWVKSQPLYYKYYWGEFKLIGFHTEAGDDLIKVLEKYDRLFHTTCCECASIKKVEKFGDEYLCKKCIIKHLRKNRISKINHLGFRYYEKSLRKFIEVRWQDFKKIELEGGDSEYWLKFSKKDDEDILKNDYNFNPTEYIPFHSSTQFNFFKLLKKIPDQYLTNEQIELRIHILDLKKCLICERKSVLDNRCIICLNRESSILNPSESQLKRFKSIESIIKKEKERFRYYLNRSTETNYRYKTDSSFK